MGEIQGNKQSLFGAKFLGQTEILAYSFNGAMHKWRLENEQWAPQNTFTGHFDEVSDIDWDLHGKFLVSTSKDQTTRAFSEIEGRMVEVARPQVHGYDINCVTTLKNI